jgi:DNA-binding LacI/PurR family transcriptional regulator
MLKRDVQAPALYLQLVQIFRDKIARGEWPPDTQIPIELDLADSYGVSRNTIRQALNVLVQDGLLERTQGRGTFVRAPGAASVAEAIRAPACEKRIGVVLSHSGDQLNMEILLGVEQACRSRGYELSFSYSNDNGDVQQRDVARLRAGGVCGFIIFPLSDEEESQAITQLHTDGLPLVLVDRYLPTIETDYVGVDNMNGGYRATEHLLILGHRRIGFAHERIAGLTTSSVRERWQGYRNALQDYGRPYDDALFFNTADNDALTGPHRPTAVFAVNDVSAIEILKAAHRLGLRVPEDLAVVGFDDLTLAAMTQPPLTTVAQPRTEVGVRAGHLLIDRIEGLGSAARHIVLPTHLVVRESCGAKMHIRDGVQAGT